MAGAKKTPKPAPSKRPAAKKSAPRTLAQAPAAVDPNALTPAQALFAREWLRDLNATQAYLRVHPKVKTTTASVEGSALLRHPAVAAEIARVRKDLELAITYDVATMIRREAEIAFADPRELVSHHVDCCRHCYGRGHLYQRTAAEMERAREAHAKQVRLAKSDPRVKPGRFDEQGGIGFDPRLPPVEDCPECFGRGVRQTLVHDTRHLSPAAAALYAGVKETKDGIQVLMQDQAAARERVERHLGAFEKDNRQRTELAEQLAGFIGSLHQSGAGRLQTKPRSQT